MATNKREAVKTKRSASLGINFEPFDNGAIVVYIGDQELLIAEIPKGYAPGEKACTAVAVVFRERGGKIPLTAKQTKAVLDKILDEQTKPVIVGSHEIADIIKALTKKGVTPQSAV